MKLSLKKRHGSINVRGGRVLRVVTPHAVDLSNRDHSEKQGKAKPVEMVAWCKEGDLALEIVGVCPEVTVGYAYLSGPAIAAHRYVIGAPASVPHFTVESSRDVMADWFKEGKIGGLGLSWATGKLGRANVTECPSAEDAITSILAATYGPHDVVVFEYLCGRGEDHAIAAQRLVGAIEEASHYSPEGVDRSQIRTHFLGAIRGRKNGVVFLHLQPMCDRSDICASPFQHELALTALKHANEGKQ
ncbi:MAG: hypothetical protein ABH877_04345 [bacterium]